MHAKHITDWSVEDVSVFIRNIGLSHLESGFSANSITGNDLLKLTTAELVAHFGCSKQQAAKIQQELSRLTDLENPVACDGLEKGGSVKPSANSFQYGSASQQYVVTGIPSMQPVSTEAGRYQTPLDSNEPCMRFQPLMLILGIFFYIPWIIALFGPCSKNRAVYDPRLDKGFYIANCVLAALGTISLIALITLLAITMNDSYY